MNLPKDYEVEGQLSIFDIFSPDIWSGKTSWEHSAVTKEKTSDASLRKQRKSPIKPPLFLDLRGGWRPSGCILGAGWSIAWRVHDAQFWGIPQRRKRVSLVADFGGDTAPKILFERKGMFRDFEQGKQKRETITNSVPNSIGEPSAYTLKIRGGCEIDSKGKKAGKGALIQTELSGTLGVSQDQTLFSIGHDIRSAKFTTDEITDPLTSTDYKDPIKISHNNIVRRLTPMECERLQGYPDHWTDIGEWVDSKGKNHKDTDTPRYKALGNSIALPFWEWMAERMCKQYDRPVTMASLFDGIGGFPLVYSRHGAKPVWASEIEEFPIAVTKIRFPEEVENE